MRKRYFFIAGMIGAWGCQAQAATPEECAKVTDQRARLVCYDSIFKKIEDVQKAAEPENNGKWSVETETSKMDDSQIVNVSLRSETYGSLLNIRCEEKVTTIYFTMGGDFMADIDGYGVIRYRIDADKQKERAFYVSTDNEALGLWSSGTAVPFTKQLVGRKKLTAQITAYNKSPLTVEFDLSGIDSAIRPLRRQCKW